MLTAKSLNVYKRIKKRTDEKLKVVQKLIEVDDPRAQAVFHDIGIYLAYTIVQYSQFYDFEYLMLLGRVMSGKGDDTKLAICQEVPHDEFPEIYNKVELMLLDENTRRVGQSAALLNMLISTGCDSRYSFRGCRI